MSSIEASSIRTNNERVLSCDINLNFHGDYGTLFIIQDKKNLNIYNTSHGSIRGKQVIFSSTNNIKLAVEYPESLPTECVISYFSGTELINSESLLFDVPVLSKITNESPLTSISIKTESFNKRMAEFYKQLDDSGSKWYVSISFVDDISIQIIKHGDKNILVSFGEKTKEILASDYIFTLFPEVSHIIIPKEIIEKKFLSYTPQASFVVSQLVSPEFVASSNIYFKIPISNELKNLHE